MGKKTYWSKEVYGDLQAVESYVTKPLVTTSIIRILDFNKYISDVANVKLEGDTTNIKYIMGALDINELKRLGVKIQWNYWKTNVSGDYIRSGWQDIAPSSVAILDNPADPTAFPIAIKFVKIMATNTSIELKNIVNNNLEDLNDIEGYEPNILGLVEKIIISDKWSKEWFVKGINGNVISMNVEFDSAKASKPTLNHLEMQFTIGNDENSGVIPWSNAKDFKAEIINYNKTKDILKPELNIFAKLVLVGGTGINSDMIGKTQYLWDKTIAKVYDNNNGVNGNYDQTDSRNSFLRAYSRIQPTWADSLSAEGNLSTSVQILSDKNQFVLKYYADRGIELQVSPDNGKIWTSITAMGTQNFDASITNKMQFKLKVVDVTKYEMYSDDPKIIENNGETTAIVTKPIIAKKELVGIKANNLTDNKLLSISGTTHDFVIKEDPKLYTDSGLSIVDAKTFFEVKYTYNDQDWLNAKDFSIKLKSLRNDVLNSLDLNNFKVRYEFTDLGKKTYWSKEVFEGLPSGVSSNVIKTLDTKKIIKTLDVALQIEDIANVVKITGDTSSLLWSGMDSIVAIEKYVKVEYGFYDKNLSYVWTDKRPTSLYTKDIPTGENNFPLAIRFSPKPIDIGKVEIGSILKDLSFLLSNTTMGYEVDVRHMITIIKFDASNLGKSIIFKGPFNDLNNGESQDVVELNAKNIVPKIFRNKVELRYELSMFPGKHFTFIELKAKLSSYSLEFSNSTSGLIFFENSIIHGTTTITAKFVSNDPAYQIVATPSNFALLDTDKIVTKIDLREYVKVLRTVKVETTGQTSSQIGNLTIPPMSPGNILFGGKTFLEIQQILKPVIDVEFKAPGYNGDKWVPLSSINSLNTNNDLYVRFVVKTNIKGIELSIEKNNDWSAFVNKGIKLLVNLPKQIVTNHKDLTNNINLNGNTNALIIDDSKIYSDLILLDPTYKDKIKIMYSIGKTPISLDGINTEFSKIDFINLLSKYKIDIKLINKEITARYALADGINPDDYVVQDKQTAILDSNNVDIYIHPSIYYDVAKSIKVDGTSSNIIWSNELTKLQAILSEGLIIQFTNVKGAALTDPINSPNWVDKPLTSIDPNTKYLAIRFVVKQGFVFGATKELVQINTTTIRSIVVLQAKWLSLIKLSGNTKDIVFDLKDFNATLKTNSVAGISDIVIQYYFGGTPNIGIVSSSKDGWYTEKQITNIFLNLKGAKNDKELILFRDSLKARYSLSDKGSKKFILSIDGKEYLDQYALGSPTIDLVTPTNNKSFEGYINMDLFPTFNNNSFNISGTTVKPELETTNKTLIEQFKYYQKNTPFIIYYSNDASDWTNKSQIIFDQSGFKTSFLPGFKFKHDTFGNILPIFFKLEAIPKYGVWEKDKKLLDGKIITIKNINLITVIDNPIKNPMYLEFDGYQELGTFKVYEKGVGEVTSSRLNAGYLNTVPLPLRLEYNVSDYIYETSELEKIINIKDDETVWSTTIPKNLLVNQYVITRVAINNPKYQFNDTSTSMITKQIRVKGLMIHADSLNIDPKILLENVNNYGYVPLDGVSMISKAQITSPSKFKNDYLGADLFVSIDSSFYESTSGIVLFDVNGIPIIKRDPKGAISKGFYKDFLGNDIKDKFGKSIPIYMKNDGGILIPAAPLRTGLWKTPQNMIDVMGEPGTFSQLNPAVNERWKLFQNQYVKFSFKPKIGIGGNTDPDFKFDTTTPVSPEIQLKNIKYPVQMNGINYKFNVDVSKIKYVPDSITTENPSNTPFNGSSHIDPNTIIEALRTVGVSTPTKLTGKNIENQVNIDSNGLLKIQMVHSSVGKPDVTYPGLDISKFFFLKNGDTIKIEFAPTNQNFAQSNPYTPLIIIVKGLNAKAPDKEKFRFLRAQFKGQINGGGLFNISVSNPEKPSQTDKDVLGDDLWFEYQVWDDSKTIKTPWTKKPLTNLKNGDKIEWKLVNKNAILISDYYNTLRSYSSNLLSFRVVNVISDNENTVKNGIGSSINENPDLGNVPQYPKLSGWEVSGLKEKIIIDQNEQKQFQEAIESFKPSFSGVNGLGVLKSNINNNDINDQSKVMFSWNTSGKNGERVINEFSKANLSNGDFVWISIIPANSDEALDDTNKLSSRAWKVTGLTQPTNSSAESLIVSLAVVASTIALIGVIALLVFVKNNKKIDNNKRYKK